MEGLRLGEKDGLLLEEIDEDIDGLSDGDRDFEILGDNEGDNDGDLLVEIDELIEDERLGLNDGEFEPAAV